MRQMNEKMNVLDVQLDDCTAKDAMKIIAEYMQTEELNTVDIVTVDTLMRATQLDGMKEELEKLDEIEKRFQAQIEAGNLTELAEVDVEFHDTIYKATNNQRLVQLLNNLREQMYRYRVEYLKDIAVRRTLAEEHRSICQALKAKDEKKALDYIRVHIDNQQKAIIRGLNQE